MKSKLKKQMTRDVRREAINFESDDDVSKDVSVDLDDSMMRLKLDKTILKE